MNTLEYFNRDYVSQKDHDTFFLKKSLKIYFKISDDRFRVVTSHVVPLYPVFVQVVQNSQTAFITIFRHALSVVQLAFAQCPGRSPLAMLTRL